MKDETDWQRQLLIGVLVLVAVGALVGAIVAVISIKAADLAGIDDTQANNTREQRPRMSESESTEDAEATESESTEATVPTEPTESRPSTGDATTEPADLGFTLDATPRAVSTEQQINLTGAYEAPDGTLLQVQRKESGVWVDFPVTAPVNGGRYATYILTGRTGPNILRMLAIGRDDVSNTVTVQVG